MAVAAIAAVAWLTPVKTLPALATPPEKLAREGSMAGAPPDSPESETAIARASRVEETSGATLRSKLLLAAAGRLPAPARLPEGWPYALERARLKPLDEARAEVDLYLDRATATPAAREAMARVLAGDPALCRNRAQDPGVKVK